MSATFSADGSWSSPRWEGRRKPGRQERSPEGHGPGARRGRGGPPFMDWLAMAQSAGQSHGGWRGHGGGHGHSGPEHPHHHPRGGGRPPFGDFGDFAEFGRMFAGFGRGFGGGRGGRRGPRVGRGDIRAGILILLSEEQRNGYQIIQELERRSDGAWRPSPGSIYPALSQLEDEGLIEQVAATGESRRMFRLTDEGRTYVESHREKLTAPWETVSSSVRNGIFELRDLLAQTAVAAMQVSRAGTDSQIAAAMSLLDETRRGLYRILADGDMPTSAESQDDRDDVDD
jgi:DNA-binding PadR family transcriptional regulator